LLEDGGHLTMHDPLPTTSGRLNLLWGTAYLAWSVAVSVTILLTAPQLPLRWQSTHDVPALAVFLVGLVQMALVAALASDRGTKLRRPVNSEVALDWRELAVYLMLLTMAGMSWARGANSRMLACGLDRLASALFMVSLVSATLWLTTRWLWGQEALERSRSSLSNGVWISGGILAALMAVLEVLQW
jgi:hypothetical protein